MARRGQSWWERRPAFNWSSPVLRVRLGVGWGSNNAGHPEFFITPALEVGWGDGFLTVDHNRVYYPSVSFELSWLGFKAWATFGRHPLDFKDAADVPA